MYDMTHRGDPPVLLQLMKATKEVNGGRLLHGDRREIEDEHLAYLPHANCNEKIPSQLTRWLVNFLWAGKVKLAKRNEDHKIERTYSVDADEKLKQSRQI